MITYLGKNKCDIGNSHLRNAYDLIETLTDSSNGSSGHTIAALTEILDSAGITEISIHAKTNIPFITAIHSLLKSEKIDKIIQMILKNPEAMKLDPRIVAIYNGGYLIDLTTVPQSSTTSRVASTFKGI